MRTVINNYYSLSAKSIFFISGHGETPLIDQDGNLFGQVFDELYKKARKSGVMYEV